MADLEGRCFVRQGNALLPADIAADEWLATVPQKREIVVDLRRPRHPEHHRWFFALMRLTIAATGKQDVWPDEKALLNGLKLAVGHVDMVADLDGIIHLIPKSISFASMPQDEFARFVRRCCWVIFDHFGVDTETMMAEVDREQRTKLVGKLKLNRREAP